MITMIRKFAIRLAKISIILLVATLGVILILPSQAHAQTETYAKLNVMAKDANGLKVTGVNFNVYKQIYDINSNKIFGERIYSNTIGETGLQSFQIANTSGATKVVAIEYFKNDRAYEKFVLWDVNIKGLEAKDVVLTLSSARVILRDADNNLLKTLPYDIWSAVYDVAGKIVAKDLLYGSDRTDLIGAKTYYLIPGDYILRIRYPEVNNIDSLDYQFTITKNQQTDLNYTLSLLKVSANDYAGNLKKNAEFKLYYEKDDEFIQIGQYSTGDNGEKKLYLPRGDYRIEFKDYNGNFNTIYNFSLSYNDKKEFTYNYGSMRLQVNDPDNDPVSNLRVLLYKYENNQQQGQVYTATTDSNGSIEAPLRTGYYIAQIEGIYHGLIYKTGALYVNENNANNFQYILSKARIYLQDKSGNNIKNLAFTLYYSNLDSQGNILPGQEIGTFSTLNNGFADVNLPSGKYIIKLVNSAITYSISVEAEKLNVLYVGLKNSDNNYNTNSAANISTTSTSNTTNIQTIYNQINADLTADSLYRMDSDNDGLADFEEYYIYKTDPNDSDSDNDGYSDSQEVKNNYNPLGSGKINYIIFSYNKPRVISPSVEKDQAALLASELVKRIGRAIGVSSKDWHTVVNSYIYGGYSIDEIKNTLVYGPGLVHPTIPAVIWRNSIQYNRAHH